MKSVYEDRCSSYDFVSEAMKDLISWGMFEIPVKGFSKAEVKKGATYRRSICNPKSRFV